MPLSRDRAHEIITEYTRLKAEHPNLTDSALADMIRRTDGALGIAPGVLSNAKLLVKPGGPEAVVRSLTQRTMEAQPRALPLNLVHADGPTLAFADTHICDVDCLWESFWSAVRQGTEMLAGHERVTLLLDGDLISGTGIFKGQELRSVLNTPHWQAMVGAQVVSDLCDELLQAGIITTVIYIRGNHDIARYSGAELGWWVSSFAKQLGVDITYCPLELLYDLGGGHRALVVHGHGYSRFRPQSPAFQDNVLRRIGDLNANREPREQINRVVSGHSHWLSLGHRSSEWGVVYDSLGGWTRNQRAVLSLTSRPTGGALYLPREEGQELWVREVRPARGVVAEETSDPTLAAKNVQRVGGLLLRAMESLGVQ